MLNGVLSGWDAACVLSISLLDPALSVRAQGWLSMQPCVGRVMESMSNSNEHVNVWGA